MAVMKKGTVTAMLPNGEMITASEKVVEIMTKLQEIPRPLTEETKKLRDKLLDELYEAENQ